MLLENQQDRHLDKLLDKQLTTAPVPGGLFEPEAAPKSDKNFKTINLFVLHPLYRVGMWSCCMGGGFGGWQGGLRWGPP